MNLYKKYIPRLYKDLDNLNGNGLGYLRDVINCTVKEVRNSEFGLELEYKKDGFLSNEFKTGMIICANASKKLRNQYFRIYDIKKDIAETTKVYAEHISFDLRVNTMIETTMTGNCKAIMDAILQNSVNETPFRMFSDITTSNTYENKLISTYDALQELHSLFKPSDALRDNFKYSILRDRGENKNVLIAYKKNISGFKCTENKDNLCTRIVPYIKKDTELTTTNVDVEITGTEGTELKEEYVYIDGYKIDAPNVNNYDIQYTKAVDFSDDVFWETYAKNKDNLKILSSGYFNDNKVYIPSFSYEIDLITLSETNEYKDMSFLEDIELCDTVIIKNSLYNVSDSVKVTELNFNVLQDKVISVKLGDESTTLKSIMSDKVEEAIKKTEASKTELQQIIEHVTSQITGNDGGYVKLYPPDNPSEIFIMDNEHPAKATKVLRINKSGIGFGKSINGPFSTAWTCDGVFNASFIKTGTMSADLIKAGTLSNSDGTLKINLNGKSVDFYALYSGILKQTIKIEGPDIAYYDNVTGIKAGGLTIKKVIEAGGNLGFYPLLDLNHEVNGYNGISYRKNDGSGVYTFYAMFDAYNRSGVNLGYPVTFQGNTNFKGEVNSSGYRIRSGDTAILYHSPAGKTILRGSPVANMALADQNGYTMLDFANSGAITIGSNYWYDTIKLNQAGTSRVKVDSSGYGGLFGPSGSYLGDGNYKLLVVNTNKTVSYQDLDMNKNNILNAYVTNQLVNPLSRSYTETYMTQSLQKEISYTFEGTTKNGELKVNVNPNLGISNKDDYIVQLTVYDNCNIYCKKFDGHFIIYTGNSEADFSCRVIVKDKEITPYKINNEDNRITEIHKDCNTKHEIDPNKDEIIEYRMEEQDEKSN